VHNSTNDNSTNDNSTNDNNTTIGSEALKPRVRKLHHSYGMAASQSYLDQSLPVAE
jgi:hypothetical protein